MNALRTTWTIAYHSFKENYKNKTFALFVIFAGVLIYASLLVGVMAVDEEARVVGDLGLALMEMIVLAYALLSAASVITREMETKTIYLIFSRPVPRTSYLAGKAIGLYLGFGGMLLAMAAVHLTMFYVRGYAVPAFYAKAVLFIWFKLLMISSAAMFISLFATSGISTVTISAVLWTLGHFVPEAKFLIERASGAAAPFLQFIAYFIPNLQLYNARDMGDLQAAASPVFLAVYLCAWLIVPYIFSLLLFRKKEF